MVCGKREDAVQELLEGSVSMLGRQEEMLVKGELCPHVDASFLEVRIVFPLGVLFPWVETQDVIV